MGHSSVVVNRNQPLPVVECVSYSSGASDHMESSSELMGVAGTWTIGFWAKRANSGVQSGTFLWEVQGSAGQNSIEFYQNDANEIGISVISQFGGGFRQIKFITDLPTAGPSVGWDHVVATYTTSNLNIYWNGTLLNTTAGSGIGDPYIVHNDNDGGVTQLDAVRELAFGAEVGGANDNIYQLYNWGWWDVILSAADVTSLYNGGNGSVVDLSADFGDYNNSADLQHYFRFSNVADRGEDLGNAATLLDMDDAASGTNTFIEACPS